MYVKPSVIDYGSFMDVTAATTTIGTEDGANKIEPPPHHSEAPTR